ncbi:hypothetical protein U3516DRAFT_803072 [Neocallimastix sp. 'constans']
MITRSFPRIGKCCFCICLSEKLAVEVSTIILMIWYLSIGLLNLIFGVNSKNKSIIVSIFFKLFAGIFLFILFISLKKINLKYMTQFKKYYGIYVIYRILSFILTVIFSLRGISAISYPSNQEEFHNLYIDNEILNKLDGEEINSYVIQRNIRTIVFISLETLISVYYYLTTGSYIENVKEKIRKEEDRELTIDY